MRHFGIAANTLTNYFLPPIIRYRQHCERGKHTTAKAQDLPDPIGFTDPDAVSKKQSKSKSSSTVAQKRADPAALKMAKAWELAYSPAKALPMNAIMLYMSGSGVQIFSMMAVGMLITGPLKGISTMNSSARVFPDSLDSQRPGSKWLSFHRPTSV
ncbi:hypothetical protein PHSY_003960 [Pseudozyma hubeiensis SY62]|uniref:ER membrane protein complex subunit 4 n=1 Tax=Pseudozyma hubeiensis (strain SY62) TaxID=1305764 RepID=R9PE79_PSEHS|nr:hypothetical protein PHSY_003960 [Pseudozyma hubeiensis SY62]GAC96380.1 hypothetical protein PHSY_003960 [Pseudozyma hubeiensis SY62]